MEVATFVNDVSQFEAGESNSQCAAFCAAQVIYMASPGHSNPHSLNDIDQLAEQIYIKVTGGIVRPIPINPEQLKGVLSEHGMRFEEISFNKESIDYALASGCPLIVMGVEGSFTNLDGASPYSWNTAGINHAIILSGMEGHNGYLVRDSANWKGNPAIYDKGRMNLFNAIKVIPYWIEYGPGKGDFDIYFTVSNGNWNCKQFHTVLMGGNLGLYRKLSMDGNSLPILGLPRTNEIYQHDSDGYAWSVQFCERGLIVYDPQHRQDSQPGLESSYLGKYSQFQHLDPDARTVEKIPDVVVADMQSVKAGVDKLITDAKLS
jgi:hypothetical protein